MQHLPPIALIIFSNDLDNYLSNIEMERKIIEEALEYYNDTNRLKIITRSSVTIKDLFRLFNRYKGRIALFHFAGHASGKGLQLNNVAQQTEIGRAEGLASLFKREVEHGQLQFVFLNGCSTTGQVEGLKQAGVPNIIATNCPISDYKAINFARTLYRSLVQTDQGIGNEPMPIQQAYETGVAYLQAIGTVINLKQKNRGFSFELEEEDIAPWELYTQQPDWTLPNEVINIALPENILEDIYTDDTRWVKSLKQALLKTIRGIGNRPSAIFEPYGWLVETFLQKMLTPVGKKRNLRRLSFMAEAFQASLKYFCYIQLSQILQLKNPPKHPMIEAFLNKNSTVDLSFDYLDFLILTTELLEDQNQFIPEIQDFVELLGKEEEDVFTTAIYLETYREHLLKNNINEADLDHILDEYLTALVYWLRTITFIAKYRLVSIKDILLRYRLGSQKSFIHLYGELHGVYNSMDGWNDDYNSYAVDGEFTYNQSILLFNEKNVETAFENIGDAKTFLSLSPLIIDQSVFSEKDSQTPEIYYFTGQCNRQYQFAAYKNELLYDKNKPISSNKTLTVKRQNNRQPKLDELYEQIQTILKPFLKKRRR